MGRVWGAVLLGVDAYLVEVEVDLGAGLPTIAAVGLPDSSVREGIDRIRAALPHGGFKLPVGRITVNLAPAELRKHGTGLDLPIAVALLAADGQIPSSFPSGTVFTGELGLDGTVRPVRGVISMALAARRAGRKRIVVPPANAEEASLVGGIEVVAAMTLSQLLTESPHRTTSSVPLDLRSKLEENTHQSNAPDLRDVRGQASARRALEIAAAGGHHMLLIGPPGAGKTMLARRLPGILPVLSAEEALEVTRVWSAAGLVRQLVTARPFRTPHHAISFAGLVGGGSALRPGEISLASEGVLYLDEMPEFRRDVLEALRQPLEDGVLTVARAHASVTLPARFTLVASMNPCPCGHAGSPAGRCTCTPGTVRRYLARVSGPLLDRFDITVDVPPVEMEDLFHMRAGESSEVVRKRVVQARDRQRERFGANGPSCNARMSSADLAGFAPLDTAGTTLISLLNRRATVSARGLDRMRRVARTIADLEGVETISECHLAEAAQYRMVGDQRR